MRTCHKASESRDVAISPSISDSVIDTSGNLHYCSYSAYTGIDDSTGQSTVGQSPGFGLRNRVAGPKVLHLREGGTRTWETRACLSAIALEETRYRGPPLHYPNRMWARPRIGVLLAWLYGLLPPPRNTRPARLPWLLEQDGGCLLLQAAPNAAGRATSRWRCEVSAATTEPQIAALCALP